MACHGAAIAFARGVDGELPAAAAAPERVRLSGRPARCLAYLHEDLVAAAGAGGAVVLLRRCDDGTWAPTQALRGDINSKPKQPKVVLCHLTRVLVISRLPAQPWAAEGKAPLQVSLSARPTLRRKQCGRSQKTSALSWHCSGSRRAPR